MSGNTGNGKSRILEALREKGEQVLHLEEMAKHKGSVLGNYHNEPQPNQKYFESDVYQHLHFKFNLLLHLMVAGVHLLGASS